MPLISISLAGCVATGRPLPEKGPAPVLVARAQTPGPEIPLVPVPPPPLGLPGEPTPPPPSLPTPSKPASPGPASPVIATPTSTANPTPLPGATPVPTTPVEAPVPTPVPAAGVSGRQLYQTAQERYRPIESYIARMIRREMVKGEMNPEEVMLFKFRRDPWSIYFKWLGKEGQGREVVFVKGRYEDKIHTLLAAGDIPFVPAGRRMALSPDNILVKAATRHPITTAGIGAMIEKIGEMLTAQERGDRRSGTVTVVGPLSRSEFNRPVLGLEHILPPGFDPSLPRGGKRTYFFDPESGLPTLIIARDDRNQEVEYYRYDRLQLNVKLDDSDFDPEILWNKPKSDTTP
jgi:hypothetical protein